MMVTRTKVTVIQILDVNGPQKWAPVVKWAKCINNKKHKKNTFPIGTWKMFNLIKVQRNKILNNEMYIYKKIICIMMQFYKKNINSINIYLPLR